MMPESLRQRRQGFQETAATVLNRTNYCNTYGSDIDATGPRRPISAPELQIVVM